MTDLDTLLAELDELHEAASRGPWVVSDYRKRQNAFISSAEDDRDDPREKALVAQVYGDGEHDRKRWEDAALIVGFRNAYPALREQIALLSAQLGAAQDLAERSRLQAVHWRNDALRLCTGRDEATRPVWNEAIEAAAQALQLSGREEGGQQDWLLATKTVRALKRPEP